jgi:glutamyl-tRNA synthetase
MSEDSGSLEDLIRGFALRNAVEHDGEARLSSVLGSVFSARAEAKSRAGEVAKLARAIIEEVNVLAPEEQERRLADQELPTEEKEVASEGLPDLPDAQGTEVVMRLAPYPSGPLHLGRARMSILNDEYVKRYRGRLILAIDDTAGSAQKIPIKEAYERIPEDLCWLGVDIHETVYKSDRLEIFYSHAERFLTEGWAYVCTCSAQELRRRRALGEECACRSRKVEDNLQAWRAMLDGGYGEGEAVVRLKTDMKDPDAAFRDRVLLRISERPHPRVGTKYRVWPMLEFSWAIDDHLLGITHILRGKDLMMEDRMERFMWGLLGWDEPAIVHHGMLRIKGAKMSSSECRRRIEAGEYEGWDDPRTWTMGSLQARGIRPEAIRSFILKSGLTLTDVQVPMETLYAENRRIIDPVANRYNFVGSPVTLCIEGAPPVGQADLALHPDFEERGTRRVPVDPSRIHIDGGDYSRYRGKEVRLKDLYNVRLDEPPRFTGTELSSIPKLQWVSEPSVDTEIVMPDGSRVAGLSDPGISELEAGSVVQFVRFGFCRYNGRRKGRSLFRFAHG